MLQRPAFPSIVSLGGEFGFNAIQYTEGGRARTGFTRTHRPDDLETCGNFRLRVGALATKYAADGGAVTVLEEVKDGIVVQCEISVSHAAMPEHSSDLAGDRRTAGGRPSSTRGRAMSSFRN